MQSLPSHLDKELIEQIQPYLIADYEVLNYSRQPGLKDAFISGEVTEVDLKYKKPSEVDYKNIFSALEGINENVENAEAVVKRAYQPKLEEVKNKYALLKATAELNDSEFFGHSRALYGVPKEYYYFYTLRQLRSLLGNIDSRHYTDRRVEEAVKKLKPILEEAHVSTDFDEIEFPVFQSFDNPNVMTAEDIKIACEVAFEHYEIEGWKAVISAPGARMTFNTNQEERVVYIPNDIDANLRKYPLTSSRVKGLIAHEIGTHVVRCENGVKSPLALLGTGLAGYLPGEEGIATYNEQKANGATNFAGGLGYLAISWAVGLDGEPRSFRGLFEIMVPYLFLSVVVDLSQSNLPIDFDLVEANVKRNAWARCVRTFRGTTGKTPGCCFTRDIIYLEGNISILQLLQTDPTWEEKFSLGKYDPTKEEHISILKDIGLL